MFALTRDKNTHSPATQGTRYTEGLLFGSVSRIQGSETEDHHERRATTHREAALSGYARSPERCGFYNDLGAVDEGRLAQLIPKGEVRVSNRD